MPPTNLYRSLFLFSSFAFFGCSKPAEPAKELPPSTTVSEAQPKAADPAVDAASAPAHVHDPSNPPIDCPLRKAGIDPTKMKPFEQIEQYIQFLEREDRAVWQKPDEVVAALALQPGETVVDLGAGSGYFAFRMASKLDSGKVIAGDVEAEMIRHVHHNAMLKGIQNVEVTLIDKDKPQVPSQTDRLFVCDVLHHVANLGDWLKHVSNQVKPGCKFDVIEFKEGEIPDGPPENMRIKRDALEKAMAEAGFEVKKDLSDLLPYQYFLEFEKK